MTLVVPRMIGAVAGFISKHGAWPTRMVVPAENWRAYRENPEPVLRSYDNPSTRAVFSRLELVPVPEQLYVAVDSEGRWFRYGEEGPDDWWGVVGDSIGTDSEGGPPGVAAPELSRPIANSYVVPGTRLVAGEYPGSPPTVGRAVAEEKLAAFLRAGITAFIDLTDPADGLAPYEPMLREVAGRLGTRVNYERLTIRDMDVCRPEYMRRVLDAIDAGLGQGGAVYVHCWGGIGRTGMVVGCWLARHGASGEVALRQVDALFRSMSPEKVRRHARWGSPQTEAQRAVVREWHLQEANDGVRDLKPEVSPASEADTAEDPSERLVREMSGRMPIRDAFTAWAADHEIELLGGEHEFERFEMRYGDEVWPCVITVDDEQQRVVLHVSLPEPLPDHAAEPMLEAVARTNFGLVIGNFEYDVSDGELRYKVGEILDRDGLSRFRLDEIIVTAVATMERYAPAFRSTAGGEEVATAISRVESGGSHRPVGQGSEELDLDLDAILAELEAEDRAAASATTAQDRAQEPSGEAAAVWALITPEQGVTARQRDRMRGALVGLAVGDAVGTTVEFRPPGSFPAVTDMVGGGPFELKPGQWTDDTSMALCLAESLIECRGFDAADQMRRYLRWRDEGHLSSTGKCFDIGNTVGAALRGFEASGEPCSGPTGEMTAGNGSLMRLAPVPVFFFDRGVDLIALAGDSSRTTHGAAVAVDACRYFAALMAGAIAGATKDDLLSARYAPTPGYWDEHPLHPVIATIADGSFKSKAPPAIRGSGYAAHALEAALWAFHQSESFREGCLLAVNLGEDADTTAAIYGQLAGAFYGESGIPMEWRGRLAKKPLLDRYAELLFQLAFGGPPAMGGRNAQAAEEAERMIAAAGGDAARAITEFLDAEERAKREMGVFAYYMSGPMSADAMREELLLHLRVALGLAMSREAD